MFLVIFIAEMLFKMFGLGFHTYFASALIVLILRYDIFIVNNLSFVSFAYYGFLKYFVDAIMI